MLTIPDLTDNIEILERNIAEAEKKLNIAKDEVERLNVLQNNLMKAIEIITTVLAITQQEVATFIEDIVTTALQHVYGEDYSFKLIFELKRNQPEVQLIAYKNGQPYDPRYSCGVGVVDVISFALRLACMALSPVDKVLLFDEPFRNVHGQEENERLGNMVSELAHQYELQIIIVSGESILTNYADKSFMVKLVDGESEVS